MMGFNATLTKPQKLGSSCRPDIASRIECRLFRYLIPNATDIMGLEWIYAFAHPEPLFPYPVMLGRAIASTIIVPDVLAKLYVDFAIALIICSYYCTMLLFLFRYCQTVDNWCHKLLSYRSYGIGISVVLLMFAFGSIIGPLHSQWGSREEMLAYAREQDTVVYEKMLTSSFVGFVVRTRVLWYSLISSSLKKPERQAAKTLPGNVRLCFITIYIKFGAFVRHGGGQYGTEYNTAKFSPP